MVLDAALEERGGLLHHVAEVADAGTEQRGLERSEVAHAERPAELPDERLVNARISTTVRWTGSFTPRGGGRGRGARRSTPRGAPSPRAWGAPLACARPSPASPPRARPGTAGPPRPRSRARHRAGGGRPTRRTSGAACPWGQRTGRTLTCHDGFCRGRSGPGPVILRHGVVAAAGGLPPSAAQAPPPDVEPEDPGGER